MNADQVKKYAARHGIGILEAKQALEKFEMLDAIRDLTNDEASTALKIILAKIVTKLF